MTISRIHRETGTGLFISNYSGLKFQGSPFKVRERSPNLSLQGRGIYFNSFCKEL
ncbi:MAG: hypothetical protein DDT26_01023 [Dehalococcoidia bacterium]|nr:hypothetical protein [Chloroflexota bacterium]